MKTVNISAKIPESLNFLHNSVPIFDADINTLIGGATYITRGNINIFLSGNSNPFALDFEVGNALYITPQINADGLVQSVIMSQFKIKDDSILIKKGLL